jgi:hypothetical protein
MKSLLFRGKFCDDSRPNWVLFGLFILSNILLIYALYTGQTERYHRFGDWLSMAPARDITPTAILAGQGDVVLALPAQPAQPAAAVAAAPDAPVISRPAPAEAIATAPGTVLFCGMSLRDFRSSRTATVPDPKVNSPDYGVRIAGMDGNSAAYLAGLRKGDIIVGVNRVPVYSIGDFLLVAPANGPAQDFLFDVFRKTRYRYITLEAAAQAP